MGGGSVICDLEIFGRKLIMVLFLKGNLRSYHNLTYGMVGFPGGRAGGERSVLWYESGRK